MTDIIEITKILKNIQTIPYIFSYNSHKLNGLYLFMIWATVHQR